MRRRKRRNREKGESASRTCIKRTLSLAGHERRREMKKVRYTIATRVLELPGKWKTFDKTGSGEGAEYVSGICDVENGARRRERRSKSEDIEESDGRRERVSVASKSENRGIRLCPRFLRPWDAEIYENSGFNSDPDVILLFKRAWLIRGNYVEVLGMCRSPGKRRIY